MFQPTRVYSLSLFCTLLNLLAIHGDPANLYTFVGGRFQKFARNSGPEFLVGDLQLNVRLRLSCESLELFIHCVSILYVGKREPNFS